MEEAALIAQLRLARKLNLPAIVTTPSAHKEKLTRHILTLIKKSRIPAHRVLIQHANERTLQAILDAGHYAGLTIHPDALSAERALKLLSHSGSKRIVLNSNLGHAAGDLLGIPRMISRWNQTIQHEDIIHRACWTHISRFLKVTPRGWHTKND
jgi:predicted metal-dependent TIM-barrel fold hydrolase